MQSVPSAFPYNIVLVLEADIDKNERFRDGYDRALYVVVRTPTLEVIYGVSKPMS